MQKYWRLLGLLPVLPLSVVALTYFPEKYYPGVAPGVVFMWMGLVCGYYLWLIVRGIAIRCPRCGWRFGGEYECGSCGLPRHCTSSSEDDNGTP